MNKKARSPQLIRLTLVLFLLALAACEKPVDTTAASGPVNTSPLASPSSLAQSSNASPDNSVAEAAQVANTSASTSDTQGYVPSPPSDDTPQPSESSAGTESQGASQQPN